MQLDFLLSPENANLLDPVYNHKQICELLVQQGEAQAIAQFRRQSKILDTLSPEHISELRCIFLNSLNRSLYNFILFTWDISLAGCCFQNKAMTHAFSTREVFEAAGEDIIKTYSRRLKDYSSNELYIATALGYINEHLDEDLSLTSVARHIFISPCYLCKIFKPLTGQTFVSYVNGQRINLAKKLLLSTDQKIDDIAAACGFHTASYFSTLFRKHNGMSPASFRSQGRKSVSADRLAPQAG